MNAAFVLGPEVQYGPAHAAPRPADHPPDA